MCARKVPQARKQSAEAEKDAAAKRKAVLEEQWQKKHIDAEKKHN